MGEKYWSRLHPNELKVIATDAPLLVDLPFVVFKKQCVDYVVCILDRCEH
jgi:hypothetical protein